MEFDREFQEGLLLRVAKDRELAALIQPTLFDQDLQPVARAIQRTRMTSGQVRQLARNKGVNLQVTHEDLGDKDFDHKMVVGFLQTRRVRAAMSKAHELLDAGEVDRAVQEVYKSHLKIHQNGGEDLLTKKRMDWKRKKIIPTGIKHLDISFGGGTAAGDVAGIVAETNKGKTSMMVAIAAHAVKLGKKIFFATLEQPDYQIEGKFARCLTEDGAAKENSQKIKSAFSKLHKRGGRCWVREIAPYSMTMAQVSTLVPPETDLIFIDYADYLQTPGGTATSDHTGLGEIWGEMKRVAMERGISVWSASQSNREGYDKRIIDTVNLAGALSKGYVADQLVTLNWDGEVDSNGEVTGYLFVSKNRHRSARVQIPCVMNFGVCSFMSVEL